MKVRIVLSSIAVIFLAAAGLLYASGGKEQGATAAAGSEVSGTVTTWTWNLEFSKLFKAAFEAKFPKVTNILVPVSSSDYPTKLQTALAAGAGAPDEVELDGAYLIQFLNSGMFEDLSKPPYSADVSQIPRFLEERLTNDKGQLIGISNESDPGELYYRRDVAKQYFGTDDPKTIGDLLGSGAPTWDKFIAAGTKLRQASGGKVSLVAGLTDMFTMMTRQPNGAWHAGNKLLITKNYLPMFRTLEAIRKAGIDAKLQQWSPEWNSSFASGSVLAYPGAPWYVGYVISQNDKNAKGNWAMVGNPVGNWWFGGGGFAVCSLSKSKAAAWEWVKFRTIDKEGVKVAFKSSGAIPTAQFLIGTDPLYGQPSEILGGQVPIPIYMSLLDGVKLPPLSLDDPVANDIINQGLTRLDNGSATADQAIAFILDTFKQKLPAYAE